LHGTYDPRVAPNALLRPVGPQPARVYWVRRSVLLAVVLVIVLVVAYSCSSSGSGTPRRPTADRSHRPQPSASSSPSTAATCKPGDLNVVATTDAVSYPAGTVPNFTASVTNNSGVSCRLPSAPADRVWTVTSGADQVWTTSDCPQSAAEVLHLLKSGHSVTYTQSWDRQRSASGCASPGTTAGPGTYVLTVSIAGKRSPQAVFHLTS
jgi:hypothetical protein